MAQKLKDDIRQAIIAAATEEFQNKGYEDASMRSIAEKANITVGNIYRYFDNKEDLKKQILAQTNDDIVNLLKGLRVELVSKEARVFDVVRDNDDLMTMMDVFAERIIGLYFSNRSQFNIILNSEDLSRIIREWFANTMDTLMSQKYSYLDQRQMRTILKDAYSSAIFSGMKDIFLRQIEDKKILCDVLKSYLRHFIMMVNEEKGGRDLY